MGLLVLLILPCAALVVEALCPQKCVCPALPPLCPPGVSRILDACRCCRLCARQFNEDCSSSQPCDHIKGLHCQMGARGDPEQGLCRAEAQGRPCEFDGRLYQHGEDFQPSCHHQCSCMDGVVGCMPLCPHRVPFPDWHCSRPRLAQLPGHCCEEWVCDDDNSIAEDENTPAALETRSPALGLHPHPGTNELLALPPLQFGAGAPVPDQVSFPQSTTLLTSRCLVQTTHWTSCSATCGVGVSSRVTNSNAACQLVRETRLCQVRPCDLNLTIAQRTGAACEQTVRPQNPVQLTFAGCSTVRKYRPRSCGFCEDGRCCVPSSTRTVRLRFRCPGFSRSSFTRSIMWILRCRCDESCPGPKPARLPSVPSDIHIYAQ